MIHRIFFVLDSLPFLRVGQKGASLMRAKGLARRSDPQSLRKKNCFFRLFSTNPKIEWYIFQGFQIDKYSIMDY
jgi:hypothetical protein